MIAKSAGKMVSCFLSAHGVIGVMCAGIRPFTLRTIISGFGAVRMEN